MYVKWVHAQYRRAVLHLHTNIVTIVNRRRRKNIISVNLKTE